MHIKKVKLQNYKTFKEVVVEGLSAGLNIIVGNNGSGKSNLLSAIECVICPESYNLRPEEKIHFINDEEESLESSAIVDVIFDNADRRLPIQKDEVTLRRVLSSKKDSFYIDNKSITKQEMVSFLESVGFSKCNPYNIVKQGKVHELAVADDEDRYHLLLDIAGVNVYNEKRQDSIKLLDQACEKRLQIQEKIADMQSKLRELEVEKQEIIDYNRKEKKKQTIEYLIYEKDKNDFQSRIEQYNSEKELLLETLRGLEDRINSKKQDLQKSSETSVEKSNLLSNREKTIQDLLEKIKELILLKSRVELEIDELKSTHNLSIDQKITYQNQLQKLEMEIKKKEQDFKINRKLLEKNKQTESSIKARLRSISGSGFSQESTLDISGTVHETSISKEELKNFKIKRDELDCQIKVGNEKMHESSMLVGDLRKRRLELIEQKKNLWNRESEITNRLTALKLKLSGTEKKWCRVMSREVLSGIKSLHTITAEHKIKGVFGAVYENLDVDARYFTCIDVTAGNKLFNVLVDASETATRILKIFKEKKFDGQITFIPINNLNVRPRSFPEHESAVPLISRIKYDSKFEKAFQLIFGQTMLCRNKQVAYEIAKEQSFDGVTLEGDQVFHRGSIVGGYVDARSGVLESYHQFSQLKTQLESHENELKMILGKVDEINDEITKISTKIINEESKYNQLKFDHQARIDQLNDCNKEITQMENFSRKIELSGISFNESAQSKENIDPNISHLSAVELEDKLRNAIFDQSKIIDKINSIEASLNNNFYITQNELKNKLCELEIVDSNPLITAKTNELAKYQSSIDEYNATVNEIQSSLHLLRGEIIEHENLREQDKIHLNSENTEHLRILSQLDGITNKISLARKKLNETENHMAIIAASEEDLSELRDKSTKWLWKNFNLIEAQLKKSTVNKKAAEDYVNLSSERDKSLRNYNELEKSLDAIKNLIERLDQKKNDTIMFTFKQVSYHFTNIFSQLYPNAYAHLILRRSSTQVHDPGQESDITSFSGVGIKVSFDKEKQNVVEISKLSGGEKTLVTLALIFAFQRCDPVPIYLFDEVDQALDANHRQTFSKMLHELSANGQFIVTTFRPEILTYSPKCFIVTFKNRVSAISQATAEKARSKIEAEKDENKT